jgi:insertion element IS1 protein InsB
VALPTKKTQKLWLLKVVSYPHGELVGHVLGNRSANTLAPLIADTEELFSPTAYCADGWKVFNKLIPEEKLLQSKAVTHTVESHNASLRHWIGRFRRRTRIVSRSAKAVSESIVLAEYLHRRDGLSHFKKAYVSLFT